VSGYIFTYFPGLSSEAATIKKRNVRALLLKGGSSIRMGTE